MNKRTKKYKVSNLSRKKKIILFSSLLGLGILTVTTVTSCTSVAGTSSTDVNPNSLITVHTDNGKNGFATNESLDNVATNSLESNYGSSAWLNNKAYELIYDWFSTNTNSTIKNQFNSEKSSVVSSYNSTVSSYQSQYGSAWTYYIQNNLFDPAGGTYNDYIQSQMYSALLTQFENDVFNSGSNQPGFSSFLSFFNMGSYKNGSFDMLPITSWTNDWSWTPGFVNNTSNWAANTNSSWNLGFFPSPTILSSNSNYGDYLYYCNFDQYLFDQWIINENPFIASSILYEYPSSFTTSMYNSSYFTNLPSSPNLAFPYLSNNGNNSFDQELYNYLQPYNESTNTTGYKTVNGFSYNPIINNWTPGASVYDNSDSATGGFNFKNLGTLSDQTGYFVTNGANITSNSSTSSYTSFGSYLPSYSAAVLNRYNALMYNNNSSSTSVSGISSSIYNVFPSIDISSNLLSNFLFSYATGNNTSSGTFTTGYTTNTPTSFSVSNPRYTYLFYNGTPLVDAPSSDLNNYWYINSSPSSTTNSKSGSSNVANNWYRYDTLTTLSFTPEFGSQLSPYTFTRDGDGIHVVAIDGYDRILAAEEDPSSIASPIDVYPNPTNSYEAAVDAIAQDILWREAQLTFFGSSYSWYKIDLFTSLKDYFEQNFASILLGYAEQVLSNSSNSSYNQLFSKSYNLFGTTNLDNIFNTNNSAKIATINLIYWISDLQNYLVDQTNENKLKNIILTTYTGNSGTSSSSTSSSSSSSSSSSFGVGSDFNYNGIKPAFMYATNLDSSLLYPYLSYYVYNLQFNNTLGLFSLNSQGSINQSNNNAANVYQSINKVTNGIYSLDQQLSTIKTSLDNAVSTYISNINLQANSYNDSSSYMNYSQYVLTNNSFVNSAIEALSKNSEFGYLVEDNILSSKLNVNTQSELSASNDLGLSNSTLANIFSSDSSSKKDSNYGSLSYLATAIAYEYFLSSFTANSALTVNYGYNFQTPSNSSASVNPYIDNYSQSIQDLTNTIINYFNDANYLYDDTGYITSNSFTNNYLKLLETIEWLYDGGTWENLWNYLNEQVSGGPTYVVWVGGDNSSNLNNTNVQDTNSNGKSLTDTGSSVQYANQLNSNLSNYNTLGLNYGAAGYTFNDSTNTQSGETPETIGYSPFNYIPNANIDGSMVSQYMDQNLTSYSGSSGGTNYAYNNISSYFYQLSDYFNLANVEISPVGSNTSDIVPFTGFLGLETKDDDTSLSSLGSTITSDLFNNAITTIGGYGILANYTGGLGNEPTYSSSTGTNNASSQPSNSLMSAILQSTSLSQLLEISSKLQYINNTSDNANNSNSLYVPPFNNSYVQNKTNISQVAYSYASAVYKAFVARGSSTYDYYFKNFSGFVTNGSSNSYFSNSNDYYNIVTGGSNLEYNNLYTSFSSYNKLLSSSYQSKTPNLSVINSLAQNRLISVNFKDVNGNTSYYSVMMYVDQISQSNLGENYSPSWFSSKGNVWSQLGLTEDAFAKLVVQIAQNSQNKSLQTSAISSFASSNKINVYDLRLRNALGIMWILNWLNG